MTSEEMEKTQSGRAGNFPVDTRKSRVGIWVLTSNKLTTILGDSLQFKYTYLSAIQFITYKT